MFSGLKEVFASQVLIKPSALHEASGMLMTLLRMKTLKHLMTRCLVLFGFDIYFSPFLFAPVIVSH